MLLQLRGVCKDFGSGYVLDHVSLTLERGRGLAVVDPSGAGKSTLLSVAGLLLAPDGGFVTIDGEDAEQKDDDAISRIRAEKIGFLLQHIQLTGLLRAIENVTTQGSFTKSPERRLTDEQADERAR